MMKIVNSMSADAPAPEDVRASAGMVLDVQERQDILLCGQNLFHLLGSSQIQDMIQNVNISFVIFKPIQHVKS